MGVSEIGFDAGTEKVVAGIDAGVGDGAKTGVVVGGIVAGAAVEGVEGRGSWLTNNKGGVVAFFTYDPGGIIFSLVESDAGGDGGGVVEA